MTTDQLAAAPRLLTRESLSLARRWAFKGGWAILDQGLFAGSNFLAGVVLLACWQTEQT